MSDSTTTLHELKATLWEAANILRGSAVDRTDWKGYILPLLFFKRISDVWDEESLEAAEIYGDTDPSMYAEIHRFQLPEGCHWNDIRETPANQFDVNQAGIVNFDPVRRIEVFILDTTLFEDAIVARTPASAAPSKRCSRSTS